MDVCQSNTYFFCSTTASFLTECWFYWWEPLNLLHQPEKLGRLFWMTYVKHNNVQEEKKQFMFPRILHEIITTNGSFCLPSPQDLKGKYLNKKNRLKPEIPPTYITHAGTLWPLIIAWFLTTSLSQSRQKPKQTAEIKGGCRKSYISWFLVSDWDRWFRLTQCPGCQNPVTPTNRRPPATIPSVIKAHVSSLLL